MHPHIGQNAGLAFGIRLVYVWDNIHGAKIYMDPLSRIAVKIEDITSPLEPEVWVNYQGDRYMSSIGTCFMLTPLSERMDSTGTIHSEMEGRTSSTPNLARIPQRLHIG